MKQKMLLMINPRAGRLQMRNSLLEIIDLFSCAGYEPTVLTTCKERNLSDTVCELAQSYDLLVCSGGDGTLNEAVNGLLQCTHPPLLGYIPAGTSNDFATSLCIPKEPLEAAHAIISGVPFACDAGRLGGRYFTYVAAFGAFTRVVYETSQQAKNILGRAAYILEGIRRLTDIKTYHMIAEHDGGSVEGDFILGMATNSTSVGGFKTGAEMDVSMNDGLLEILLVRMPQNHSEFQTVVNSLFKQELDFNFVCSFKTAHLRIVSETALPWTLDGEYGGTTNLAQIDVAHKAFHILIPHAQALFLS